MKNIKQLGGLVGDAGYCSSPAGGKLTEAYKRYAEGESFQRSLYDSEDPCGVVYYFGSCLQCL